MKKKLLLRALLGFPLGVFITTTISILFSMAYVFHGYLAVTPALAARMGGQMPAVLLQYFLSGLLGSAVGALSLIWDMERFSIIKRTLLHFLGTVLVFLPVSVVLFWSPFSLTGTLFYLLIFVLLYFGIWLGQYLYYFFSLRHLNQNLPK